MKLETTYMGLKLAHPFMLGASPLTGHPDNARRLEDGGCSALVMHSVFEEQIRPGSPFDIPSFEGREFGTGQPPFLLPEKLQTGADEYLEQLRRIKAAVSIPVIGSLNGTGTDGWLDFAQRIEQAGADALELNVYYLSTGPEESAATIEARIATLVRTLKNLIQIPVAVKLAPYYTAFANTAASLDRAGADGLVLFNRFYQTDIDIETLAVIPNVRLSTSAELLLRLRWLAILSGRVQASLAVTGGAHTVVDGVKALLAGAHVVQMVSAILQQGPQHFRTMEHDLRYWMMRHEYETVDAFRGLSNLSRCASPSNFERGSYLRVLQGWSG